MGKRLLYVLFWILYIIPFLLWICLAWIGLLIFCVAQWIITNDSVADDIPTIIMSTGTWLPHFLFGDFLD